MRNKWMKIMIYLMIIAMFISLLANLAFMF
ncbi:stressosome-associated protein Prli42 [Pseudalkalibacillus salsuginis]|nr:stressosome-associated protein Prli42 [Pseudalkalibacillus salsuginis]MCF6408366.1 stressosome-associated protein Prli42 [Pseudalkalibacillus salsuginis]